MFEQLEASSNTKSCTNHRNFLISNVPVRIRSNNYNNNNETSVLLYLVFRKLRISFILIFTYTTVLRVVV